MLEELSALKPETRWMFGCFALYVGDKVTLILRERPQHPEDNGVWLATSVAHHGSLRAELPSLRHIALFGGPVSDWQVLPSEADTFEEEVLRACAMVRAGDPRIGRVPAARKRALKAPAGAARAPGAAPRKGGAAGASAKPRRPSAKRR
ncbi:MAG: hypothetical protein HY909_10090 [Deltaproteobacteria bacterium]|nr:hypothetical protein [Deltaproteobacteria bacterium]